jgi:ketosteroid isomerase-like protein
VSETTTDVKTLVGDFFATMGRGEWDRLRRDFLSDGSSWTMMAPSLGAGGPQMDSGDAIVGFFSAGGEIFENGGPEVTINRILVDGDHAAVEAVGNGKLHNGKTYENVYHFAVDTKDGRILAVREYMDSHHVATVMGPPPA